MKENEMSADARPFYELSCEEFARINQVKAESVRARLSRTGSYFGVVPVRLANGRLAFPSAQVRQGPPMKNAPTFHTAKRGGECLDETPHACPTAGETHIADIHIAGQAPYRLFLLPGDADELTHQEATDRAAEQGGTLPNRFEQALLFAHHKDAFEKDWYWSDTQRASSADYAWCQGFGSGVQYYYHRDDRLRARAVRRLPI